jgi:hypothetical protein
MLEKRQEVVHTQFRLRNQVFSFVVCQFDIGLADISDLSLTVNGTW